VSRAAAVALFLILPAAGGLHASLPDAQAEPNLERRSKLALDNAGQALTEAREAYAAGDRARLEARAVEIGESVELAQTSLRETGKNPRKNWRWFKRAEIETRDLLRRLESFQEQMSVADRDLLDGVIAKVQKVHDDLLQGVMEGKPK